MQKSPIVYILKFISYTQKKNWLEGYIFKILSDIDLLKTEILGT